jgi:uncharacterized protein (DUF488 family)
LNTATVPQSGISATAATEPPLTVWTIGHSVRTADELIAALRAYDIELVADVRRFPGSRRLPQFSTAALELALAAAGVAYCSLPALGGRRKPLDDSPNDGWRVAAFRGYADYLATEEFAGGLMELVMLASGLRTAVMCAEVLWWRCHRRLIADVLVWLGIRVMHIRDALHVEEHRIAPPARIVHGALTYAADGVFRGSS